MQATTCLLAIALLLEFSCMHAYVQNGVFKFESNKKNDVEQFSLPRSLYKGCNVTINVQCKGTPSDSMIIQWTLRQTPCWNEAINFDTKLSIGETHLDYNKVNYASFTSNHVCGHPKIFDFAKLKFQVMNATKVPFEEKKSSEPEAPDSQARKRRDVKATAASADAAKSNVTEADKRTPQPAVTKSAKTQVNSSSLSGKKSLKSGNAGNATSKPKESGKAEAASVKPMTQSGGIRDTGVYILTAQVIEKSEGIESFSLEIQMEKDGSFLSPMDFPLYVFYSVMCAVYTVYAVYWLLVSCWYRKDMLRIQYWIGLVILLGLVEKAFFLREYTTVKSSGVSATGGVLFAEIVSALKRALARMLVVIVSLGFGIVKPRLGAALYKVLGLGLLSFVLACIEAYIRVESTVKDFGNKDFVVLVPLTLVDAVFVYWIYISITQTMRTLRVRRNVVKLSLYRHFCNTLIFCLLAAVVFMIWSIKEFRFDKCLKDWKELWLNDAYWHILFAVILLVIIVLWRPSQNNQRYAFSPLLDEVSDEEEEEEFTKSGALETMKSRSKSPSRSRSRSRNRSVEDDLKWVEDNIPASVADSVLPMLDSDDEIAATRKELAKMD